MRGMLFRPLSAFLLLSLGLMLAGCQSRTYELGEITTSVEAIDPDALPGDRAVITLRFVNDNIVPVSFIESKHKVKVNGVLLAEITNPEPVGLAPLSTTTRDYPVVLLNPALVRQWSAQGVTEVAYELDSVLLRQRNEVRERKKGETSGRTILGPAPKT